MFIVVVVIFLKILHWYGITRRKKEEPQIVSGSLPLIGHAHKVFGNQIQLWENFKNLTSECLKRGHALYMLIGSQKFYVLTDPDDIYTVSNTCFQKDTEIEGRMKLLLGDGILLSDVHTWKKHRKIILPSFNQKIIDSFLPIFNSASRVLAGKLKKRCGHGVFDHSDYLRLNSLQVLCRTIMGVEIDENEGLEYVKAYDQAVENGLERYQKFWLNFNFIYKRTHLSIQQENCINTVRSMTDVILSKKREILKVNGINNDDNNINMKERNIFLDQLLDSEELTDEAVKEEVHSMIIAGSDTSSNIMILALILIGSYPDVQEKLYSELNNICGESDRDLLKEDLASLTYLEAVIKETMRYYVLVPLGGRFIDKEVKLKNCTLQPGNNCFLLFYGVHRHEMWGEDADQFKPERWTENRVPSNCNAFVAFGLGKRNCVGRYYAMMIMKTTLAHIIRRFRIHADHRKMKLKFHVLIKPDSGHYISLENREN